MRSIVVILSDPEHDTTNKDILCSREKERNFRNKRSAGSNNALGPYNIFHCCINCIRDLYDS